MFKEECRSFIVLFPEDEKPLQELTAQLVSNYYPFCEDKITRLHFTICYFNADLETCQKIAFLIDEFVGKTSALKLSLQPSQILCAGSTENSSLWWNVELTKQITETRENILNILKGFKLDIDHELNWFPHIKICDIDNDALITSEVALNKPSKYNITFKYMQLSRLNPETTAFEILRSWELK